MFLNNIVNNIILLYNYYYYIFIFYYRLPDSPDEPNEMDLILENYEPRSIPLESVYDDDKTITITSDWPKPKGYMKLCSEANMIMPIHHYPIYSDNPMSWDNPFNDAMGVDPRLNNMDIVRNQMISNFLHMRNRMPQQQYDYQQQQYYQYHQRNIASFQYDPWKDFSKQQNQYWNHQQYPFNNGSEVWGSGYNISLDSINNLSGGNYGYTCANNSNSIDCNYNIRNSYMHDNCNSYQGIQQAQQKIKKKINRICKYYAKGDCIKQNCEYIHD